MLLETAPAYHQQTDGQTEIHNKKVVTIVHTCELEADQWVEKLLAIQLKVNSGYQSSRSSSLVHTLYGFTPRFGEAQMRHPLNKMLADTDRHAPVAETLNLANEGEALQANKGRN